MRWPNGTIAHAYSADEPDQLRGPQHDAAWADELAKWKSAGVAWHNLELGLRVGSNPRVVVTTTPRPIPLLRQIAKDPMTVVTRGSTYDNRENLTCGFLDHVRRQYEGTRLGRQELYVELLDDVPGALWTQAQIDQLRMADSTTTRVRLVVAVDPAVTSGENSSESGIIVAEPGCRWHGYIGKDLSGRFSPDVMAQKIVRANREYNADLIVAEVYNGGDMIEQLVRTVNPCVRYRSVRATRGKYTRAEPIAALYEQGRVHHVGQFPELEEQMCSFVPGTQENSPDRMDALVWALTELITDPTPAPGPDVLRPRDNLAILRARLQSACLCSDTTRAMSRTSPPITATVVSSRSCC